MFCYTDLTARVLSTPIILRLTGPCVARTQVQDYPSALVPAKAVNRAPPRIQSANTARETLANEQSLSVGVDQYDASAGRLPLKQASSLTARELTSELKGAQSWRRLRELVESHGHDFNGIHVSAALAKAAKLTPDKPNPASNYASTARTLPVGTAQNLRGYATYQGQQPLWPLGSSLEPSWKSASTWQSGATLQRAPAVVAVPLTHLPTGRSTQPSMQHLLRDDHSLQAMGAIQLTQVQQVHYADANIELLDQLLELACKHAERMQARAVANCIWSAVTCIEHFLECSTQQQQQCKISSLPQQYSGGWQANIMHGSWHSPGTQRHPAATGTDPRVPWLPKALRQLQPLLVRAHAVVKHFEAQHVSSVLYALAKANTVAGGQVKVMGAPLTAAASLHGKQAMPSKLGGVNGDSTSRLSGVQAPAACVVQAGNVSQPLVGSSLIAPLLARACEHMAGGGYGPQALSNTLYALASMQYTPDDEWMLHSLHALAFCMEGLEPQHVSNILWAYAKLGYYPGDEAIGKLLASASAKVPAFTPQAMCITLWALATLQYVPEVYDEGMAGSGGGSGRATKEAAVLVTLVQRLANCAQAGVLSRQDISNAMWAAARLQQASSAMQAALLGTAATAPNMPAVAALHSSSGQTSLPLAVKNQAQEQQPAYRQLVASLANASVLQLHACNTQQLANAAWALSALRVTPSADWVLALQQASLRCLSSFKGSELAGLALAMAKLGVQMSPAWIEALLGICRMLAHSGRLGPQDTPNLLWALAQLQQQDQLQAVPQDTADALLHRMHTLKGSASAAGLAQAMWAAAQLKLHAAAYHAHIEDADWMDDMYSSEGSSDGSSANGTACSSAETAAKDWMLGMLQQLVGLIPAEPVPSDDRAPAVSSSVANGVSSGRNSVTEYVPGSGTVSQSHKADLDASSHVSQQAGMQQAAGMALWALGQYMHVARAVPKELLLPLLEAVAVSPHGSGYMPAMQGHAAPSDTGSITSMQVLQQHTGASIEGGSAQGVTVALWLLGRLRLRVRLGLMKQLSKKLSELLPACSDAQVAMSMWGMARLRFDPGSRVLHAMLAQLASRVLRMEARHLACIVWSLAALHAPADARLLRMVAARWRELRVAKAMRAGDAVQMQAALSQLMANVAAAARPVGHAHMQGHGGAAKPRSALRVNEKVTLKPLRARTGL